MRADDSVCGGDQVKRRVIFVDDEEKILKGLARILFEMEDRWDLAFALGAEEGLARMREAPADAIVTDLRMPVMDGLELLGAVRVRWPATARLVLTAHMHHELLFRALRYAHHALLKPCSERDIVSAISRWLDIRDAMGSDKIRGIVLGLAALPLLPSSYQALKRCVDAEGSTEDDLWQVAMQDVSLAAEMFRYGGKLKAGGGEDPYDMRLAASRLGLGRTRELLGTDTLECFSESLQEAFRLAELQTHSARVARMAASIAAETGSSDTGIARATTAGYLHDVGKTALIASESSAYSEILEQHRSDGAPLHMLEKAALGTTHAEVGQHVALTWGVSGDIAEAIGRHHDELQGKESGELWQTVRTANAKVHGEIHDESGE